MAGDFLRVYATFMSDKIERLDTQTGNEKGAIRVVTGPLSRNANLADCRVSLEFR